MLTLMMKAQRRGDLVPVKKQVTRGGKSFMQTVWVSPKDAEKMRGAAAADKQGETKKTDVSHGNGVKAGSVSKGDTVSFTLDGKSFTGEVTATGRDGVRVNSNGMKQNVLYENIEKVQPVKPKGKEWLDPASFKAADWSKQWIDQNATPDEAGVEYVLKGFGADSGNIAEKIDWAQKANKKLEEDKELTHQVYRISGEGVTAVYSPKRAALHGRIIQEMLSPDKIIMAKPGPGEKPTLMMLGGRGGSGKSWFKIDPEKNPGGGIYDPSRFVILDADSIKEQLRPPYDGWNAFQVHEESSDILERAIETCISLGLNVVLDMTMKTPKSVIERITKFKEKGYSTGAHYMHLTPQEAAKRAIVRYRDGEGQPGKYKGRFIPVDTILAMRQNEEAFDVVKDMVDDWSFWDSSDGFPPALISAKNGKKG